MKVKTKKDGRVSICVTRETADQLLSVIGRTSAQHSFALVDLYDALKHHATPGSYVITDVRGRIIPTLRLRKREAVH